MVEDREPQADLDVTTMKRILRDLRLLREQFGNKEPDENRINALLHRLTTASIKIAEETGRSRKNLESLSEVFEAVCENLPDNDGEVKASAASNRGDTGA